MNIVIDLTAPRPVEKESELVSLARTGRLAEETQKKMPPVEVSLHAPRTDVVMLSPQDVQSPLPEGKIREFGEVRVSPGIRILDIDTPAPAQGHASGDRYGRYERHSAAQRAEARPILPTLLVILFVLGTVGVFAHFVSRQICEAKWEEFKEYRNFFSDSTANLEKIKDKKEPLLTKNDVENRKGELDDLKKRFESIRTKTEKLGKYQFLFHIFRKAGEKQAPKIAGGDTKTGGQEAQQAAEKQAPKDSGSDTETGRQEAQQAAEKQAQKIAGGDTTQELIQNCRKKEKEIDELISNTEKHTPPKKKAAPPAKSVKPDSGVPHRFNTIPMGGPNSSPPAGREKKEGKEVPPPKVEGNPCPVDDVRFLWQNAKAFHRKNGSVTVRVGEISPGGIRFLILPNVKAEYVMGTFKMEDGDARSIRYAVKYEKGVLAFASESTSPLPKGNEILVRLEGKDVPLFFRVDISKLRPGKEKGKIEIDEKTNRIRLFLPLEKPDAFYTKDNMPCEGKVVLSLKIGKEYFDLVREDGNWYSFQYKKMRNVLSFGRWLFSQEKKMYTSPVNSGNEIREKLGGELGSKLKALLKDCNDWEKKFHAKDTPLLKNEDLREREEIHRNFKSARHKLSDFLCQKVPLNILKSDDPKFEKFERSLKQTTDWNEKRKKALLKDIVEKASLCLTCQRVNYEQFPLKEAFSGK